MHPPEANGPSPTHAPSRTLPGSFKRVLEQGDLNVEAPQGRGDPEAWRAKGDC